MSLISDTKSFLFTACILLAVAAGFHAGHAQDQPHRPAALPGTTLKYKSTVTLDSQDSQPQRVTLSPRGDRLLVHEFFTGDIKIYDLDEPNKLPLVIVRKSVPGVDAVWSQDQTRIATSTSRSAQVFDAHSGARLGERTVPIDGCWLPTPLPPGHGMGFTADSKQIWFKCFVVGIRSPSTVAIRLTVPEMAADDKLIFDIGDKKTIIDSEISILNGNLILAYAKTVWPRRDNAGGSDLSFGAHDLSVNKELSPSVEIGHIEKYQYNIPYRILTFSRSGLLQRSLPGNFLDVFDLPVSRRLTFGDAPGKRSSPPSWSLPMGT